jgi:hypothetical protein
MTHSTSIALALTGLLLAACANTPPDASSTQVSQADVVCSKEAPTGSMMPRKVCAAPMTDEERQRLQSELANKPHPTLGKGN